jgi:hypothetical protein
MRIAVVGAQNVGKTTFVKDFVAKFSNYITPNVSYRDIVLTKGLKINQETGEESQAAIMQFIYNLISENKDENIIFDRCLIDNYVYSHCAYLKGAISGEFIEVSKETMFSHLQFLETIIFIPVSLAVELESDKLRDTDKKFIDTVNRTFVEILLEVSRRFEIRIIVLSGSREERLAEVAKKLGL